jgi:alpha-beta hydrolase superfamily lysophospholipase
VPEVNSKAAPARPTAWEERLASRLFRALSPSLPRYPQPDPPRWLQPAENLDVPRPEGPGILTATWYPASGPARGAVLLLHPWVKWGKAYFYRGGRIEALRAAGYHTLALDLAGFGGSGPPAGLYDRDVAAGLAQLRAMSGDLPLHVWGVSSGGFWAHLVLSRMNGVAGAMFEEVSPHLLEWSWRMVPRYRPGYFFLRCVFPRVYRFLDIRRHASALQVAAVAYVSGSEDPGVLPADTRKLAERAGAPHRIIPGARHLAVISAAPREVFELALSTFAAAENGGHPKAPASPPPRQPGRAGIRSL